MKTINKIEITNSSFFTDGLIINFSDKLNCIMGGRGTGKSTILLFIKSCLEIDSEDDKNVFNILKNNLDQGKIVIQIAIDNDIYRIEKTFGEIPQVYLLETGQFIPFENIKTKILCDVFPSQMIEDIGKSNFERLKLIDRMLHGVVKLLLNKIEVQKIELEKNAKEIRSSNLKFKQVSERLKDYSTIDDELISHRSTPPEDINEQEKNEFDLQDKAEKIRSAEKRFLEKLRNRINEHLNNLVEMLSEVEITKNFASNTNDFINKGLIDNFIKELKIILVKFQADNKNNQILLSDSMIRLNEIDSNLKDLHESQHNEFVKLKQKLEKHKTYYDKLNVLTKRLDEKNILNGELKELEIKSKKLKEQRGILITILNDLKKEIFNNRLQKINSLNKLFANNRIKITLTPGGITDEYEDSLKNALKGHSLRYNIIVPYIVTNLPPDQFAQIIHNKDIDRLKEISGIDKERSQAVLDALYETEAIYQIESIYCPDLPDFYLKIDKQDDPNKKSVDLFKKSDELSTGQRCTTVLPIVFAISDNPLLIDQPEDNLDNKYISDTIREIIKEQKGNRQLIFITHNPNIPVLSDAENNIFLRYEDKKSDILKQGSIDLVKNEILNLLEGGEEAFNERDRLYKKVMPND